MYCLRLFIVVLQELHCCYCGVFTEKYVHTEFHLDWLLCYVPIVMYCLRLFIVVLQEVHCFPNCLHIYIIRV